MGRHAYLLTGMQTDQHRKRMRYSDYAPVYERRTAKILNYIDPEGKTSTSDPDSDAEGTLTAC